MQLVNAASESEAIDSVPTGIAAKQFKASGKRYVPFVDNTNLGKSQTRWRPPPTPRLA
jgi:hypothetical protein